MFEFLRNITKPAEEKRQERLNAYLDGALPAQEQRRFEQELEQDAALRADLEQLRWVKLSVEQMPRMRAPRNFILDPAVHGLKTRPQPARSLYPGLRVATALTAFFFILTLALDLSTPYGALSEPLLGGGAAQIALEDTDRQADDAMMATEAEVASQPQEEEASDGDSAAEMAPFAVTEEGEVAAAADEAAEEVAEEEALLAEESMAEDAPANRTTEQPAAEEPAMPGAGASEEVTAQAVEATAEAEKATETAALELQATPTAQSESAPLAIVTDTPPVEEPAPDQVDGLDQPFPYLLLLEVVLGVALAALVVVMFILRRGVR